jgi:hypothetical protein
MPLWASLFCWHSCCCWYWCWPVVAGVPAASKMFKLSYYAAAVNHAIDDILNAVGSLHEVPVFACDHADSGAPCFCWHPCSCRRSLCCWLPACSPCFGLSPCCFWRIFLLLASLLLATFLMLLAPCMKSLFLIVPMLLLAHHVAAGIPAVGDVLNAVGSLHKVPVFACVHAVSGAPCCCWHPCCC